MNRISILLLVLLLITGCASVADAPGEALLVVTDGTTTVNYSLEELEALAAEEAAFRDVVYVGVPLSVLLEDAGFDPAGLRAVRARAVDDFTANYEPELFLRPDTLVAYAQADGPLTEEDGDLRMVLPEQEGRLNVRQLVEITVVP